PELTSPLVHIELKRCGSFGAISSADATSLALAITELITNAIEHRFLAEAQEGLAPGETLNGHAWVTPDRQGDQRTLTIADGGRGVGDAQSPGNGCGSRIVRAVVSWDLAGAFEWPAREGGATLAVPDVPMSADSYD